ncbi:NADH dehydrogenase subunit J [Gillisia sp. Hel_I_86]|uniref:NADH-quinone oxidoreductase subunit J family protein n=1 Tax=Gillisia sp. Hel_I_86 TaxID=1249981 RepID=UPI0011996428|nr:NADH-quinone oxidoreductase subunit J [Gillisia sp. Hel_I_86]TVZ28631.1 NADH dehydrogenase subunit J [Gillisia sp. Hel_I_86]
MVITKIIFLTVFGLAAIWFGWRVFMTSSMVRSALSLLACLTILGLMFFVMQAEFLAVLQVMMMATEMAIMAIFMMMFMMDPGGMGAMEMTHQKKLSIVLGTVAGAGIIFAIGFANWGEIAKVVSDAEQQNRDLGREVLKRSMMIFETAGTSILVAMIVAAAIALPFENKHENQQK